MKVLLFTILLSLSTNLLAQNGFASYKSGNVYPRTNFRDIRFEVALEKYYIEYKKACYNDSIASKTQIECECQPCDTTCYKLVIIHKEPTFEGFMEWVINYDKPAEIWMYR